MSLVLPRFLPRKHPQGRKRTLQFPARGEDDFAHMIRAIMIEAGTMDNAAEILDCPTQTIEKYLYAKRPSRKPHRELAQRIRSTYATCDASTCKWDSVASAVALRLFWQQSC